MNDNYNIRRGVAPPPENRVKKGEGSDKYTIARVYDLVEGKWIEAEFVDAREMVWGQPDRFAWHEPAGD